MSAEWAVWSFRFDVFRIGVRGFVDSFRLYRKRKTDLILSLSSKKIAVRLKATVFPALRSSRFILFRYAVSQNAESPTHVVASGTAAHLGPGTARIGRKEMVRFGERGRRKLPFKSERTFRINGGCLGAGPQSGQQT
jgi:hypothetical protein